MNKLVNEAKLSIQGKLNEYECANALKQITIQNPQDLMESPLNCITQFGKTLFFIYISSINYSIENKQLTELQKQGLLTLLPKPDKNITLLSNWRPICLLNIDFKIATKATANRIKDRITKKVDVSETGFIKGRYIGENIG